MYIILRRKFREYFWKKEWYQYWILYRLRSFLGKSYLKNGWHDKTEMEYLEMDIRRIENKLDTIIELFKNK